jgi:hypothetical protein
MANLWHCFEDLPGLIAVPAGWQGRVGKYFEAFKVAFLTSTGQQARSFPSPYLCECSLRVCSHRDGSIVAVSECGSTGCKDQEITSADVMLWELNWKKLGRAVAGALECEWREADIGIHGTRQIGSFGAASVPVILTIQHSRHAFADVVRQVVLHAGNHFVLLSPTSRFLDANSQGLLKKAHAGFFDLESNLGLLPSGALHAAKKAGELFSAYLPEASEPANDNEARRLFALIQQLESENAWRKAPTLQVFRLYCMENLSRNQVARRCGCVPSLITLRLKAIEKKLGRKPSELRQLSSHFEAMENSLSDSRAKEIYRKGAMDESGDEDVM